LSFIQSTFNVDETVFFFSSCWALAGFLSATSFRAGGSQRTIHHFRCQPGFSRLFCGWIEEKSAGMKFHWGCVLLTTSWNAGSKRRCRLKTGRKTDAYYP
jgi:hypothetical protein